jgi:quercetin dioxygenase-like cupin family protein
MSRAPEPSADTPVTRVILRDDKLPEPRLISRVQAREIRLLPSVPVGLHSHNGPVFGAILAGSVVYQIDGQPESVLGPGDAFYEPEGERIARFDARDDGATFIAFFPLSAGQEPGLTMLG